MCAFIIYFTFTKSFGTFSENENKLSSPLKRGPEHCPGTIFEFYIDVGEFKYIFGEKKQTFLPYRPNKGLKFCFREMFEFCISVSLGEFCNIFGKWKQTFLSPKAGTRGIVPGKFFEFCITAEI